MRHPFPHTNCILRKACSMEFWEFFLFVHDFKVTVWLADGTQYIYLASLQRDSMLHTQRHAISPKHTYLVKKKHSPIDPQTHSSSTHACNRKYAAATQERSLETGNDSGQKRLFQREERYHQISVIVRKGWEKKEDLASITRKEKDSKASDTVIIKRKRANCESFKSFLYKTQGLFCS